VKVRLMHPTVGELGVSIRPFEELTLGRRGGGVDVELNWDARVSRRHARLWEDRGELWFEDLGSQNGSFLGSERIMDSIRLQPGKPVILGETIALPVLDDDERNESERTFADEIPAESAGERTNIPEILLDEQLELTEDLRASMSRRGTVEKVTSRRKRAHPRYLCDVSVAFRREWDDDWRSGTVRNISIGGVFVEATEFPDIDERLQLRMSIERESIYAYGAVVRYDAAIPPTGFGVSFADLSPSNRGLLKTYVESLQEGGRPTSARSASPHASGEADWLKVRHQFEVLSTAQQFLYEAERKDLYSSLRLAPTASMDEIAARSEALRAVFEEPSLDLPLDQMNRVALAGEQLRRVALVLADPLHRIDYDFRNGFVRAEARLAEAESGVGPSLSWLREAWNRALPEQVEQAAQLMRDAFQALENSELRKTDRLRDAIDAGVDALVLNPFFAEFRNVVESWKEELARINSL
jgi:hypothetical protein